MDRLARSEDRTAVDVPTVADEAIRDLSWAREATLSDLKAAPARSPRYGPVQLGLGPLALAL